MLIRRSESAFGGELLLRLKDGGSAYVVQLPLEQARMLAVEMRGLATDHCQLHHMALHAAQILGAEVSHVIVKNLDRPEEVMGVLRLVMPEGLKDVEVDAAAALAMAVHLRLPIFMDANISSSDSLRQLRISIALPNCPRFPRPFANCWKDLHMPDPEGGFPI